jgi:hypothetical protein
MGHIWVLGGGRFGARAARRLGENKTGQRITVVDHSGAPLETVSSPHDALRMDAVAFLSLGVGRMDPNDLIVPAIPIHVAYEWVRAVLLPEGGFKPAPVPEAVASRMPHPIRGSEGQVYTSNADFICPDTCNEPDEICTKTGRPRPSIIFEMLARIRHPEFRSVVIRSRQLRPGVGGYYAADLLEMMRQIRRAPGGILLSTACKCHGVMHAFRWPGSC